MTSPARDLRDAILDHYRDVKGDKAEQAQEALEKVKNIIINHPGITLVSYKQEFLREPYDDAKPWEYNYPIFRYSAKFNYDGGEGYASFPIHWAAILCASSEIVEFMIENHPQLASQIDTDGCTALALCSYSRNYPAMKCLFDAYPEGVEIADRYDLLPLHKATSDENIESVQLLVKAYPDGIKKIGRFMDGEVTPLHYAVENAYEKCTELFLDICPEAAKIRTDDYGDVFSFATLMDRKNIVIIRNLLEKMDDGYSRLFQHAFYSFVEPLWKTSYCPWGELTQNTFHGNLHALTAEDLAFIFQNVRNYPLLHEAIGAVPVEDFIYMTIDLGANITLLDSHGRSPLLVLLQKASQHLEQWDEYYKHIFETIIWTLEDVAIVATNDANISSYLVDLNNGSHFLHIATGLGLPWDGCINVILNENIKILSTPDINNGLLPFMCGSDDSSYNQESSALAFLEAPYMKPSEASQLKEIRSNKMRTNKLSAMFELLRFKPDILEAFDWKLDIDCRKRKRYDFN